MKWARFCRGKTL